MCSTHFGTTEMGTLVTLDSGQAIRCSTPFGIATMGRSAEGATVDMLQRVSHWFLREETLRAAHAVLVYDHNRLDLRSVCGDGSRVILRRSGPNRPM